MADDPIAAAVAAATEEVNTGAEDSAATGGEAETTGTSDATADAGSGDDDKPAPKTDDEGEDDTFFNPTAEELDAINANPELKKVYKSMQRGLTKKAEAMAALKRDLKEKAQLADWIQTEPEKALAALQAITGVGVGDKTASTEAGADRIVAGIKEKWAKSVGPEAANILMPLVEETIREIVKPEVDSIRQQTGELAKAANERGIAATVREFGAAVAERGEEWDDEIQAEMAQAVGKVAPASEDTTMGEYLEYVYDAVFARRVRSRSAKANLERLKRVRDEAEPTNTSRSSTPTDEKITSTMSEKDQIALAVKQARKVVAGR